MRHFGIKSLGVLGALCGVLVIGTAGNVYAGAVISNGVVRLGVNDLGALNFGGFGLFSIPSGSDSTFPGCTCEGWGAGIASTGQSGYQNTSVGTANLSLVSFTSTASTAVSTVNVLDATGAPILRVTHDYHPLATTSDLYEVTVSITNLTGGDLAANDLRYRRVMDWDIPFPGSERVTMAGVPAVVPSGNLFRTDNNGFNSGDPFDFTPFGLTNINFTDESGDIGALFDFQFEALANGATRTFNTYYGRSVSKAAADLARAMVDGDPLDVEIGLYSYGTCSTSTPLLGVCDFAAGTPDTFIFGFGGAGGILDPTTATTSTTGATPEPASVALLSLGLAGVASARRARRRKSA